MQSTGEIISNERWLSIFNKFFGFKLEAKEPKEYMENIGVSYAINPVKDHIMTTFNSKLFNIKKAAAMYFWFKKASAKDTSILDYFDEYKRCIDAEHTEFNSNYGIYAYKRKGLKHCIEELTTNKDSRQACFCINNNIAMSEKSIDKLCTNTIQFFIRGKNVGPKSKEYIPELRMVVQMRSSNFLTLLPYDIFMFSVFHLEVYTELKKVYPNLVPGTILLQVASLHCYRSDWQNLLENEEPESLDFGDTVLDYENFSEYKLKKYLKSQL